MAVLKVQTRNSQSLKIHQTGFFAEDDLLPVTQAHPGPVRVLAKKDHAFNLEGCSDRDQALSGWLHLRAFELVDRDARQIGQFGQGALLHVYERPRSSALCRSDDIRAYPHSSHHSFADSAFRDQAGPRIVDAADPD